jgi:streptogramin lyase
LFTAASGALYRVDATTGNRTVLSDFDDPAQGPVGSGPIGVAVEESGQILVTANALFRVDPTTGIRMIVSDFSDAAQGPPVSFAFALVVEGSGQILVSHQEFGSDTFGALLRVDPTTGARTLLSDFGDLTQGPQLQGAGVSVDACGRILLASIDSGGKLFSVSPTSGIRTVLSNFSDSSKGPLGDEPFGVTIDGSGQILVADAGGLITVNPSIPGLLFRVDPTSGVRTLLSDFSSAIQGPLGANPVAVAVEESGQILVVDVENFGVGALFRVDPTTGTRALLSDLGDATQGPVGGLPAGVVVYGVTTTTMPGMTCPPTTSTVSTTSTSSSTVSTSTSTTTTTLPPPECHCPGGKYPISLVLGGQLTCICVPLEPDPDILINPSVAVVKNVIKYGERLTKCSQKGVRNLIAGRPSGVAACALAASAKYDRTAAEIQPPRCVDQAALQSAVDAVVPRYNAILFCNQAGARGALPPEFGGGYVPAPAPWKTERAAQKVLMKHGKALGKCITKAVSDVVRGKTPGVADCLSGAHEKAIAAAARLDFALAGFGRGTGCYEAPTDLVGLIDEVERLAGTFVPEVLCFQ